MLEYYSLAYYISGMRIEKLTGALGAVIKGVDLETIDDATFGDLHEALMDHQVVFLRDQKLTEDGHRALAARFGTPTVYPLIRHFGGTEFLHHIEDTAESPPDADGWHSDITWIAHRPKIAILCGIVIPSYGGDTMWVDLYGAWDQLSPTMHEMLALLQVLHTPGEMYWESVGRNLEYQVAELREVFPGVIRPLVLAHPVTGRNLLNLGGYFMDSIVGMHPDESAWLLGWLNERVDDPNLQVRWSWSEGDVAIWDEYSTLHRALSDHYPQHRKMRRCTVDG